MKYILSAFLILFTQQSFAWTAIAYSPSDPNKHTHTAYGFDSEIDATQTALANCNKNNSTGDCEIVKFASGKDVLLAVARGKTGFAVGAGVKLDDAINSGMKICNENFKGCKLSEIIWDGVGSFATAGLVNGEVIGDTISFGDDKKVALNKALDKCKTVSKTPELCSANFFDSSMYFAMATTVKESNKSNTWVKPSMEEAEKNALDGCREYSKEDCKILISFNSNQHNPVPKDVQRKMEQLKKEKLAKLSSEDLKAQKEAQEIIKNGYKPVNTANANTVSCKNSCINGRCVRTFSDGRKDTWQAPRVYNAFTSTWDFDITTNACGV